MVLGHMLKGVYGMMRRVYDMHEGVCENGGHYTMGDDALVPQPLHCIDFHKTWR